MLPCAPADFLGYEMENNIPCCEMLTCKIGRKNNNFRK